MSTGAEKPEQTKHAAAGNSQAAEAQSRLHSDAQDSKIVDTPAGRVIELKVQPQDGLLNLGRELYQKYAHHAPAPETLKAFELDAGKRNGLNTAYARDHLHPGQTLHLKLPGVELPHAAAPHVEKTLTAKAPAPAESHHDAKKEVKAAPASPSLAPSRSNNEIQAIMKGAESCSGEWSQMVAQWVSHNEVSKQKFLAFNPNDHGAGISIGLLQWNQKKGRLPELLQDWHKKDPGKFDHLFGAYSANLLNPKFVRTADFVNTPVLYNGIKSALGDGEYQSVQLALRDQHINKSCQIAQDYGFKSLRGRAVVADLFNQIGEGGVEHAIARVPVNKPESARIEELKRLTGDRTNGHDRVSSIEDNVKVIWHKLGEKKN